MVQTIVHLLQQEPSWIWVWFIMAKIVQTLTRPSKEYDQRVADSQVRDLDAVIQKLNTTFQQELKDEVEAFNFFLD